MRTFGTITRSPDYITIECEPQVAMRFKRWFAKVKQKEALLHLADTPENARDLVAFLERYPMKMSKVDRRYLGDRSDQHKAFGEDVGRIVGSDYVPREYKLAVPLRPYQRVAADLALLTRGLWIGDDVGLGKTAEAIAVLSDPSCRPALVVTLTHLPLQLKAELERFIPGIKVHVLKGGKPYPLERQPGSRGQRDLFEGGLPDVIISNYHKLSGWAEELAGVVKAVVFDEVQELRHSDSAKYAAAKRIAHAADLRLGLSATPIFNLGGEIFNIMEILRPGALGNRTEFTTEWLSDHGAVKDPRALGSYLLEAGFGIRRTRAQVGRELPALTIVPYPVEVDFDAINKMAGGAAELARLILRQGGAGIEKMKEAAELNWRLRQATGIAKAPQVADLVRMLAEGGEKVLLAGWHHEVYGIWREKLKDLKPVFFTGEESPAQKQAAKDAFVDGDSQVLVMSLRAGAGIDGLQKVCSTVVIGEPDWSPAVHEQFGGRVFRDGQPNPVFIYFPLGNAGSDPVIADVLGIKRAQLEGIRDPKADIIDRGINDPDRMRKLARAFLEQRGETPPEPAAESDAA